MLPIKKLGETVNMNNITAGDKVNVYFEHVPWIMNATVQYLPCSPDDSYILMLEDGRICDVKNYSKIEQVEVKDDNTKIDT